MSNSDYTQWLLIFCSSKKDGHKLDNDLLKKDESATHKPCKIVVAVQENVKCLYHY
jgi:hypothetical protein